MHFSAERLRFSVECNNSGVVSGESAAGLLIYAKKTPNAEGGPGKESDCEPTGEPPRCGSSCASENLNPMAPVHSQRNSFYGRRSPTSDFRIAAAHTSSCIASLRLHVRSGNSTSGSGDLKPGLGTDWPGRQRRPFPE